jgi:2-C-methyl-D-erythritol 4-phosphate cytidylyltransferase
VKTYDRDHVWLIQTPQGFRYEDILAAHRKALSENWAEATDDSVLLEKLGIKVKIVEGTEENIKVTTPNDLDLIKFLQDRR